MELSVEGSMTLQLRSPIQLNVSFSLYYYCTIFVKQTQLKKHMKTTDLFVDCESTIVV